MLSQILDEITKELSGALNLIWSEKDLETNLKKLKSNPELGEVKERVDRAQELLLELQAYAERFETVIATAFYFIEDMYRKIVYIYNILKFRT